MMELFSPLKDKDIDTIMAQNPMPPGQKANKK